MDSIKILLRELVTCNILDKGGEYSYNGVCLEQSSAVFHKRLLGLYEDALADILLLNTEEKDGLMNVVEKCKVLQSSFDAPNYSHLEAMNHDIKMGNNNPELKKERDFVELVCECVSLQKHYLSEFASAVCGSAEEAIEVENDEIPVAEELPEILPDDGIIKGVKGLAEFLGCGINTAQNIINSEILSKKRIQYRAGKVWRFRKDKLSLLLEEEPEVFKKVGRK